MLLLLLVPECGPILGCDCPPPRRAVALEMRHAGGRGARHCGLRLGVEVVVSGAGHPRVPIRGLRQERELWVTLAGRQGLQLQ